MEWWFGLIMLIVVVAFLDDVHTKWHKREMVKAKTLEGDYPRAEGI